MTSVLWTLGSIAYSAVALWWMRYVYGHWRANWIDDNPTLGVEYWGRNELGMFMAVSCVVGVVWPLSIPFLGATHLLAAWLDSTPVRSDTELRERERQERVAQDALLKEQAAYIERLERELLPGGSDE